MILQTPEDFHEFRQKGLCGSDMAAIAGITNWTTPLDVYMRITEGVNNFQADNERMLMGRMLEGVICERYEKERDIKVIRNQQIVHDKYDCIRGNIDGWNGTLRLLPEFKNVGGEQLRKWYVDGKWMIPPCYRIQLSWYCLILNPDKAEFAVLFNGNKFQIIPFERNLKLEEKLLRRGIQWWENHIVGKCKPEATQVSDIDRYTRIKPESMIEANEEIEAIVQEINKLQSAPKRLEQLKGNLKLYMKDKQILVDRQGNKMATFTEINATRLDTARLKQDHVYEKYAKESRYRRLSLANG